MKRLVAVMVILTLTSMLFTSCSTVAETMGGFDKSKIDAGLGERNAKFAFDIFKAVNKEDSGINVFVSPFSIATALTMTYQGAEGTTREAMAKALQLNGLDDKVLNESYKNLLRYLKLADSKVKLDISNSIWIREGKAIKKEFVDANKNIFDAYVAELDFSKAGTADTINKWIDNATKGKITKMIDPPIPSNIIMYLINAIYFKGQWSDKFDRNMTFDGKFNLEDGNTTGVKMMSRYGTVDFTQEQDYKAVRLPYGNGKLAMYCILPPKGTGINDFAAGFDFEKWSKIRGSLKEVKDFKLQLPRFNMEYGIKNLNDALTSLGMGEAFSDSANFSGMGDNLAISRVLHKAVIEVNEEGSTAAGVTVVEIKETAAAIDPPEFVADRPFMFIISDDETGSILFMGKLMTV